LYLVTENIGLGTLALNLAGPVDVHLTLWQSEAIISRCIRSLGSCTS